MRILERYIIAGGEAFATAYLSHVVSMYDSIIGIVSLEITNQ